MWQSWHIFSSDFFFCLNLCPRQRLHTCAHRKWKCSFPNLSIQVRGQWPFSQHYLSPRAGIHQPPGQSRCVLPTNKHLQHKWMKITNDFTSIFLTISKPSITFPEKVKKKKNSDKLTERVIFFLIFWVFLPKTTCFASNQWQLVQVMKNWQPFVPGPLFA